jgi:hypothetical protein
MTVNNIKVEEVDWEDTEDIAEDGKDDTAEKTGDDTTPADRVSQVHLWPAFANQPGNTGHTKSPLSNADDSGEVVRIDIANSPICSRLADFAMIQQPILGV